MQRIFTQGQRLVDDQGREHIFHGVNLKNSQVEENPPFDQLVLLDENFFRRSKDLGFGLLRLGLHWKDVEPEKGKYNEAFLQKVDEIFDLAAQYDMYIFLDMHQDTYGGMPEWATLTDGYERKPEKFVWAEAYFWGKFTHRAFDHFWANDPVLGKGLQDHMAETWQMYARRYGNHPALFGFDLLNEPFPGTAGGKVFRKLVAKLVRVCAVSPKMKRIKFLKTALNKNTRNYALDVLTPEVLYKVTQGGAAEKILRKFYEEQYSPFVAKMTQAIREVTQNGIIIAEQSYWSNIAVPFTMTPPEGEHICYSPHGYDFMVDTPAYEFANNARVGAIFEESRRGQQRLGVPVIVGEWGGGGEGESFFPHIKFLMDLYDSYNWSNTYFAYGDGFYDQPIMRVIARPYPMAVNGAIKRFATDQDAKTFTLEYEPQDKDLPTEIYLPNGYESIEAGDGAEAALEGHVLKIKTKQGKIVVKYT